MGERKENQCFQNDVGEIGLLFHARSSMNESRTFGTIGTRLTHEVLAMFFEIATSRGPILVDQSDADLVAPYKWYAVPVQNGRSYAHARQPRSGRDGKRLIMHRLITGAPKGLVVHHKNNNGLDNRRENLEVTTFRQNTRYVFAGRSTGVHFDADSGKWRVAIRASFGMYSDEAEARDIARGLMEKLEDHLALLHRSRRAG